jgi:hypothetical protein
MGSRAGASRMTMDHEIRAKAGKMTRDVSVPAVAAASRNVRFANAFGTCSARGKLTGKTK